MHEEFLELEIKSYSADQVFKIFKLLVRFNLRFISI